MRRKLSALFLLLALPMFLSGCAMFSKQTIAKKLPPGVPQLQKLEVDFIPQEAKLCGPTVLKMATQKYTPTLEFQTYKQMSYREELQGSTKADMLSTIRRIGLSPYQVSTLPEMFENVSEGRPVIVFQNLAVSWMPAWHYSLLVGYDTKKNVMVLHSDRTPYQEMDFDRFANTWKRGEKWAYVAVPPNEIPKHATFENAIDNAIVFEYLRMDRTAQQLYLTMLERWPKRFEPHLGLANIYHSSKNIKRAIEEIDRALMKKPNHPALLFNLATLYFENGQFKQAKLAKEKTIAAAPADQKTKYEQRFTF